MNIAKPLTTALSTALLLACCSLAQAQTAPASAEAATKPAANIARESSLQVEAEIADAGQKSSLKARIAAPGGIGFTEGARHYRISVNPLDGNSYRVDYQAAPHHGVGGEKQLVGSTEGTLIAEIGKKAQVEISNGFKLSLTLSR